MCNNFHKLHKKLFKIMIKLIKSQAVVQLWDVFFWAEIILMRKKLNWKLNTLTKDW